MTNLELMNTFFDPFFDNSFGLSRYENTRNDNVVKTQIKESEDEVNIYLHVPGYSKEQLSIEYHDKQLTITGNVKAEDENHLGLQSFKQSVRLSDQLNPKALNAKLENGILQIKIPVDAKVNKPKSITIK